MTNPEMERGVAPIGADDRRTEPRFEASGRVLLRVDKVAIPGRLLDVSEHGMRVEHMYAALASGMVLEVERDGARQTARVIWNRIKNEGVESGFYLL
jgi:hypothetical protein